MRVQEFQDVGEALGDAAATFGLQTARFFLRSGSSGFLRGLQQGLFDALAVGHVLNDAEHAHRLAVLIAHDVARFQDPADGPIGPDDAMLDLVLGVKLDAGVDGIDHTLAVLGVDAFEKRLVGGPELAALKAEQGLDLVGPMEIAGEDVPVPTADVGCPLGQGIPFFAALERARGTQGLGQRFCLSFLCPLTHGDFCLQGHVGRFQFGRALSYQLFQLLAVLMEFLFSLLAGSDVAIADSAAEQGALLVGYRLAEMFDPADLAIAPQDAELDLAALLAGFFPQMLCPGLAVLGKDNLVQELRVGEEFSRGVAADALARGRHVTQRSVRRPPVLPVVRKVGDCAVAQLCWSVLPVTVDSSLVSHALSLTLDTASLGRLEARILSPAFARAVSVQECDGFRRRCALRSIAGYGVLCQ